MKRILAKYHENVLKRIDAYVRLNRVDEVKQSLEDAGIFGLSCEQVRGFGKQLGQHEMYRGSTYALNLVPKMRVTVVVEDEHLEIALDAIITATRTGEIGDGKIFISEVQDAIRIRTGERGSAALQ